MKNTYKLEIGDLERELPIVKISDEKTSPYLIILGDMELVNICATELVKIIPKVDYLVTAETRGIPLVHEMARQLNMKRYIVARKNIKCYRNEPISASVISIRNNDTCSLFLNKEDEKLLKDKNVLLVDDIISTGDSMKEMEALVKVSGANVIGKAAILVDTSREENKDMIYIKELPMFTNVENN